VASRYGAYRRSNRSVGGALVDYSAVRQFVGRGGVAHSLERNLTMSIISCVARPGAASSSSMKAGLGSNDDTEQLMVTQVAFVNAR